MAKNDFDGRWPDTQGILEFIRELSPGDDIYPRRLLNLFSRYFGCTKSMFYPCMKEPLYREGQTRWAAISNAVIMNIGASAMRRYSEYYFEKDLFAPSNLTREQRRLKFMRIPDIMPYDKFEQTEYYKFLQGIGCHYQSDLLLKDPDDRIIAYLAFFRTKEEGDFTDEQARLFATLSDYISPLYLSSVRASTYVSVYPMLDLMMRDLSIGAALVDNRSMLLWANRKALEYGDSFVESKKDTSLKNVFFIGEDQIPLQQLIGETSPRLLNEKTLKIRAGINDAFTFYSQPFSVQNVTGSVENRILVFIVKESTEEDLALTQLINLLTSREKEVLELICSGSSNKDMAEKLSISVFTLRTHVANIYKKLGVNSKASLLLKMNRK